MYIFIKNMVCVRCMIIVREIFDRLKIPYIQVELGRVQVLSPLSLQQRSLLDAALHHYELEVMDNARKILVERIKTSIIDMFHSAGGTVTIKFSEYLSRTLQHDYTYLANTFSEIEGSTIERFYITQKIQRVKELIRYEGMSIKEISFHLNYSSVSHLCKQFKKIAGVTPAAFRKEWVECWVDNEEEDMTLVVKMFPGV